MNVLVTGGGTVAPIDDVRRIVNVSSGKFSAMLSEAFLRRECHVTHLSAPGAQRPFHRLAAFDLSTHDPASEMARLGHLREEWNGVRARYKELPLQTGSVREYADALGIASGARKFDLILLAMAVSDYEPTPQPGKLDSSAETLEIRCRRTPKVIRAVRSFCPEAYLVGFKLLSGSSREELIDAAHDACRINQSNATIANDLTSIHEGRHEVILATSSGTVQKFGPGEHMADGVAGRLLELATGAGTVEA